MVQIYGNAALVIVWLGTDEADCRAFKTVKTARQSKCREGTELSVEEEAQSKDVEHLIENGYWGRVWIIQEVRLSGNVILWCGAEDHLVREDLLYLKETRIGKGQDAYMVEFILEYGRVSMATIFLNLADQKCSKPHDRIYGIQSLLNESERLEVDYDKTIQQVFLEIADVMLAKYSLKTIESEGPDQGLDVMTLLWTMGVSMDVFKKDQLVNEFELENSFFLVSLFPHHLDREDLRDLIAKWLPSDSQAEGVIPKLAALLKNTDGRLELIEQISESQPNFRHLLW
jgi:hypothetical protein